MSEYKEYPWDVEATDAHSYLYPVLKQSLANCENKKIIDIGCGNGVLANRLIKDGFDVYGIDASKTGIKIANSVNVDRFFLHDINSGILPKEIRKMQFDVIISTEVIEHLYAPRNYMELCKRILPVGGIIILSTPFHGYLKNLAMALSGKLDTHFTVLWDGGHIKFWSRKTIEILLNEFDFKVTDFRGAGRVPYLWKSMFITAELNR
jgi:2-polyprenyl-3-methyl-5-hydroxy-6-metoxy-1,4-benzoquinol methylase